MKVTVEVCSENNGQYLFGPTGQILRGRWSNGSPSMRGMTSAPGVLKMPDTPGMYIEVDTATKRCRVYDPLSESPELMAETSNVHKAVFGTAVGPQPETVLPLTTDTDAKSILYWLCRMVKDGHGRIVSGTLPSETDLRKMPGRIRVNYVGVSPRVRRYEDEPEILEQTVPVGGQAGSNQKS